MKRIPYLACCLLAALSLAGIGCLDDDGGGGGGGGGGTPTPTPTPEPPGSGGTVVIGEAGFCEIGDAATLTPDAAGNIRFSLPPKGFQSASACDNGDDRNATDDEYSFIFVNTTSGSYDFQIDEPDNLDPPSTKLGAAVPPNFKHEFQKSVQQHSFSDIANMATGLREHYKSNGLECPGPQCPYTFNDPSSNNYFNNLFKNGDAVGDEVEVRFASDVDTTNVCANTSGIVRKIGTYAKIIVDRDMPYDDVDPDDICDDNNILCLGALNRLSGVIDNNIVPLLTHIAGDYSDVDGNDMFTVFITPRMNEIPFTDGVPDDLPIGVPDHGYTEETNLLPFDATNNPCSNEQEIIFVHAPDPNGYFNAFDPVPLAQYLSADVFGAVIFQLEKLVSYNQHVFENDGEPEEPWLSNALGMMFVDLAGFFTYSPAFMSDVYIYFDSPGYFGLTGTRRWYDAANQGFQYLFGKFLLDSQVNGTVNEDSQDIDQDVLSLSGLYGTETGIDNIEANLAFPFDDSVETEFEAAFKQSGLAMVASGTAMEQAGSSFPYYLPQNTTKYGSGIGDASGSTRAGANGGSLDDDAAQNPVGILYNGTNVILAAGVPVFSFLLENADHFTYVPGNDFDGFTAPLAINFVRAGGLFEVVSNFAMKFSNSNGKGFVVRRPDIDPAHPIVHAETVHGTLDPTHEVIGTTTVDYADTIGVAPGKVLTIVGAIDKADFIGVVDVSSSTYTNEEVPDFDYYDITIPVGGENLVVWLESQVTEAGGASLLEPMLAIVSADDVPNLADLDADNDGIPRFRYVITAADILGNVITYEDLDEDADAPCGPYVSGTFNDSSPSCIGFNSTDCAAGFSIEWSASTMVKHFMDLFVLKPVPDDPPYDPFATPAIFYEGRHPQTAVSDCDGDPAEDLLTDDATDLLGSNELRVPEGFQEQILSYMMRERVMPPGTYTGTGAEDDIPTHPLRNGQAGTVDLLAVDIDSRDENPDGEESLVVDYANKAGGYSVKIKENGLLQHVEDSVNPLIPDDAPTGGSFFFDEPTPNDGLMNLEAGVTYTIVVSGKSGKLGRYELKMRHYQTPTSRGSTYVGFD